jgi:hypothetical protein
MNGIFANTSASSSYFMGGLGIGTTSPLDTLDVWGNLNVATGSIPVLFINTAADTVSLGTTTTSSTFTIQGNSGQNIFTFASSTGVTMATLLASGRFGLGTSSPVASLAIVSATGTNPLLIASSTGSAILSVLQNGNIGIGTSTPVYTLDVNGTARANSVITSSLVLSNGGSSSYGTISAYNGFNGYINTLGGIGTGGVDSIANSQRITSSGNLINIGSIQAGELALTRAGTFLPKVDYSAGGGSGPAATAVGDVNGDGKPDIATANWNGNNISVFMNNGTGTYATKVDYSAGGGSSPRSISMADVNGDGKADLIAPNYNADTVSVYMNNGNGTFATKVDYPVATGAAPRVVDTGDLNGDGKIDFAVVNYSGSTVSVFMNKGDGTFLPRTDYTTGNGPRSVAIGDVNGDGKPDFVTGNYDSNTISVFINNGNGIFANKVDYTAGNQPRFVGIGDLNGDGKADLASANLGSDNISVLLNNGTGTFATKVDYSTGVTSSPYSLGFGDVNGDGKTDLVTANSGTDNVSVFVNNGNGTFATKADYPTGTGSSPYFVTVSDLNNDGKNDLAIADFGTNAISVIMNSPSSLLSALASTGAVGVGTSTSLATFMVQGVAGTNNPFTVASSSGTTLFTVLANGNVGVGSSTPGSQLSVRGSVGSANNLINVASSTGASLFMVLANGNIGVGTTTSASTFSLQAQAGLNPFLVSSSTGASLFDIDTTGAISASNLVSCGGIQTNANGLMSCTSDARLKDIQNTFSSGLSAVLQITPQTYSWKSDSGLYDGGVLYSGFIAQNIESAIPEAVNTNHQGNKQINTTTILAAVVNAVKELAVSQASSTVQVSQVANEASSITTSLHTLEQAQTATSLSLDSILAMFTNLSTSTTGLTVNTKGALGIGTTHPIAMLHVASTATGTLARFENTDGYCDIDPTTKALVCTTDDSIRTNAYLIGSTSTVATSSDITATIASSSLERLSQLHVVTYNLPGDTSATTTHAGLVLSDIQTLFPELVKVDTNGKSTFALTQLIPYIIESIKSLADKVSTLALEVSGMKTKVVTNEICVGTEVSKTCINKEKLDQILLLQSSSSASASIGGNNGTSTQSNIATSTQSGNGTTTPPVDTATSTSPTNSTTTVVIATTTPDTIPPVITINGSDPETITQSTSTPYVDAGATAVDNVDGVVNVVTTGTVDRTTIGTYTITYTATDSSNNVAVTTRAVIVQ